MADYKAVSMNLMHGDIRVTDSVYAPLPSSDVQRRIARLGDSGLVRRQDDSELADYLGNLPASDLSEALHAIADRLVR